DSDGLGQVGALGVRAEQLGRDTHLVEEARREEDRAEPDRERDQDDRETLRERAARWIGGAERPGQVVTARWRGPATRPAREWVEERPVVGLLSRELGPGRLVDDPRGHASARGRREPARRRVVLGHPGQYRPGPRAWEGFGSVARRLSRSAPRGALR